MTNLIALPVGTVLVGDYRIQRVLGAGGFGVTYLAEESALSRVVTLKEYFPSDFAARKDGLEAMPRSSDSTGDFQWGRDRFIDEAKTLAKLDHPNIVRVYRYFEANNTAYMVLQFEEGLSFKSWLKGLGRAPRQKELDAIVGPLLDALEFIHKADYLHRDIAPDNIIIRKDNVPVLIDFGSARGEIAAHSKTVSALVKPGYSPYEQYAETSRQQGPWSDLYALAATLYHAITGKRPPDSPSRIMKDEYVPARESALGAYRAGFLKAIDKALLMNVEARPQSVAAWRGDVLAPDPPKQSWLSRGRGAKQPADAMELAGAGAPPALPAAGMVPPQPDAPGVQGGLLDFFDGLRGKAAGQPVAPAVVEEPPAPAKSKPAAKVKADAKSKAEPKAPEVKAKPKAKGKTPEPPVKSPPANKAAAVKTVADRATPARPRPVHGGAKPRRIGLITKLALAAAVAGGVVLFQNQIPSAPVPTKAAVVMPQDIPVMLREFKAHDTGVHGVAFTQDGRNIVSVSRDATLKIWNAVSGSLQKSVPLDNRLVTSLAVSGRRAVTGHSDGTAVLFDLDRGERIAPFKRNDADIWAVTFLGNQDRFATVSHDYITTVWEAKNPSAPQFTLQGHESSAQAVAYSEHGPWIATGSADMSVRLYDVDSHDLQRVYKGAKDFVTALAFSPDGKSLAVASLDGSIRVYSTSSTRLQKQMTGHKSRINSLAYSPDGTILASAADEGIVRLWDARRGRTMRSLGGHAGGAKSVSFAPDGTKLASSGSDGMIRLWSVPPVKARE
ncbi:MAG: protein kinase [Hyphomicrobiaceae bacterium]